MKQMKKPVLRAILGILIALVTAAAGYVAYVFIDYHRIEDMQPLEIAQGAAKGAAVRPGETCTALSFNIGFGAYTPDFSFFMDGGDYSWAWSEESVKRCTQGVGDIIVSQQPDFVLLQEVDVDSTRSWHVDQKAMLDGLLSGYDTCFAVNYDSPFLMYPLTQPHGKSKAGLAVYSRFPITSSLRRSLPISTSLTKLLDLDRCYTVSRIPISDGRELVLYTVHLTAYTSDHSVRDGQLAMLRADMEAEYAAGNAVICGGDFNMEMLSDQLDETTPDWARPMDRAELGQMVNAWDVIPAEVRAAQPRSCRDTGEAYTPGQTPEYTLDTFVVSPNVIVDSIVCLDAAYAFSDHNPVLLTFRLQ